MKKYHQHLAIVLVLCMILSMLPVRIFASSKSTVSTNLAEQSFTVNEATEFTVTTCGNDDAGKMVWGSFTVQQNGQDINLQDVAKLEYQESSSGAWYEFYGDFGPASGFPMGEGEVTSHFKVTFRQTGSYDVRIAMVTANEAREVLCELQETITVAEVHHASTVSTNLAEQSFTVNTATEFTVTTHGNDDAGEKVWGSFTVQQNGQAINLQDVAKLEYQESSSGEWYEFYGDFGPSTGFPMGAGDVTSHFKVTFRQAGSYDVRIAMVTADEARKEVCAVDATIMVQKEKVTVSVTKEGNGKIEINGQEVTGASLPVNKNEEVTVTITPESGSYIKTLSVAGESKSVNQGEPYTETLTFDADATIAVKFVAEHTVTVDEYDSNAGSVTLNGQSASSITVDKGEEVSICVTANKGYQISSIKISGEEQTIQDSEIESKTITHKVEKNCTVTVTFVRAFKVTVSYDDTIGSVSVAGATVANEGSVTVKETDGKTITVVATPNSNYHVSAFTVNGIPKEVSPENGKGYEVDLPAEKDYKIEVTFALDTYTITFPLNGYDGEFTDQDGNPLTEYTLLVEHGAPVRFKFVPKAGYAATVTDDKNELAIEGDVYQIENVTKAHTIFVETKDVQAPSVTPFVSDANAWKQEKRITFTTADNSGDAVTLYVSDKEYSDLAALREAGLEAVNEYTVNVNGTYYIYAVDKSENFSKTSVKVEMIDTTAPEISQPQQVEAGRSYYQSITYTFTVTDTQSDVKRVSYGKDQDGNDAGVLTLGEEGYQFTVTENGTYYVFAEDNAGNRNSVSVIVENVDTTLPDISDIAASKEWDNASNTVSFVAKDNVGVNGAFWSDTEYFKKSEIIENAIKLDGADGKYEFSVQENGTYYIYALDEAGNVAKDSVSVTHIDKVKPTGKISMDTNTWSELISVLTFGIWKNTKVEVTAVGEDGNGSGWDETPLYYKFNIGDNGEVVLSREELEDLYSKGEFSAKPVTVEEDEKFIVYACIVDKVGNYDFISTDGIIYDNTESVITLQPEKSNDALYYNSNVTVGILVNENVKDGTAYSGIQKISYKITKDDTETYRQDLYSFSKNAETGKITIKDWASGKMVETPLTGDVPLYDQLKSTWEGSITVDATENNSDHVKVIVYVTDNAGNEIEGSCDLKIDTVPPEISQPQRVDTGRNYDQSITYTFTVTDTQSGVKRVSYGKDQDGKDASVLTLGDGGYQFTVTENGTYYVFAEDNADNPTSVSVIVENVDTTPPTISNIAASEEWNNASNTVSFAAKDNVGVNGAFWSDTEYFEKSEIIENAIKLDGTDGKYEFSVQENGTYYIYALDEAGNVAEDSVSVTHIERVEPTGKISMDENTWSELISVLTFGLWKNTKVEVTAVGFDEGGSGWDEKPLYYKSNAEAALSWKELEGLYSNGKFSAEPVTVEKDEKFVVYARIADNAGNYTFISTDGLIYDNTESVITLQPEKPNDALYYNSDVTVGILVNENVKDGTAYSGIQKISYKITKDNEKEENVESHPLYSFSKDEESGVITIKDWASGEEKVTELTGDVPLYDQLKSTWEGSITVDATENNSDHVKVIVYVTDNAGNSVNNEENPCVLQINSTPPTATLTSNDTAANTVAGHGYFTAGRTFELTITDRNTTFNEDNAINGFSVTATDAKGEKIKDENGNVIEQPYALSEWRHDGDVHRVTVTFPYDANYKWSYKYTNKADLSVGTSEMNKEQCASPLDFTVDTTAPFGTVTVKSAEGREAQWDKLAQGALHFGFWSREKITLRGTFDDLTSPIAKVEYYKVSATNASDGTVALKRSELDAVTNWQRFEGFDVFANEQFIVYIKATDQAGNDCYLSTDGLIIDDKAPEAETIAPEITLQPQQPVNGIYNGDVKVDITVVDPLMGGTYSGLKKVSYKVFNMGELTQEETLFAFDSQNPQQGDLKQIIERTIVVDNKLNNSNDVVVRVYAQDNAANSSEREIALKIDTTAPTINVSYDNNNADSQTYFKANRTATIVVTERNFDPKDINVKITGTGGSTPKLSEWRETKGSGNLDNTRWTATVTYSVDGDYSFDIAYTDLANNPCPGAQYGNSIAPKVFTIDKTLPVIRVTYDNNEAQNTNYYKAARTATIMINEHNFSTDRIQITLSASDDGVAVKTPAVSGWTNSGDTHTATITFADDAFYGFDIAYTDLAGNAAADFERQSFYVDQTPPALTITGVKDKSANKGDVIPKITYSDTNFDADTVEITLVGANRKDVLPEGEYQEIHNGAEFTFKDFEEKKEIDDIYTLHAKLTDKAGNTSEETITFSVNRFGSTYALSEAAEKLNGTYVQTPIDVVITETNADPIKNIKLTMFKNNETIVLSEGEDYVVELTGGEGQWYCYAYTIFAKNFENDGVYRLTLHSEDAAGNVAENTLDTKESAISFGVDSTSPTITITNLESDETYALESIRVSMSANDNLMLASVAVYLDDYDKVFKSWNAEEVAALLAEGNAFEFDVDGNSTKAHKVKIVCTDAAGNETVEEITDFYVTTNLFVRYYTNTPLFIGSIVGVAALIGAIIFLIAKKKKKDETVSAK